jgi:hypothetical protein
MSVEALDLVEDIADALWRHRRLWPNCRPGPYEHCAWR